MVERSFILSETHAKLEPLTRHVISRGVYEKLDPLQKKIISRFAENRVVPSEVYDAVERKIREKGRYLGRLHDDTKLSPSGHDIFLMNNGNAAFGRFGVFSHEEIRLYAPDEDRMRDLEREVGSFTEQPSPAQS